MFGPHAMVNVGTTCMGSETFLNQIIIEANMAIQPSRLLDLHASSIAKNQEIKDSKPPSLVVITVSHAASEECKSNLGMLQFEDIILYRRSNDSSHQHGSGYASTCNVTQCNLIYV